MRVALVSQEYPPETAHGGIASQTFLKAQGLASLGHHVHVISSSVMGDGREYMDGPVRVSRIPHVDARLPIYTDAVRWLTYSGEVAAKVTAVHSQTPLDIIDFAEYGAEGYIYLLNRVPQNSVPAAVVQLHGPLVMFGHTMGWPDRDSDFFRIGTEMERTCVRLADAIFSSSQCSADWCARHYGVPRERIPVIHMGVDTDVFYPREVSKNGAPTIVFVGKIERNKGVELLLEAACNLAREFDGLRLRMLGRGNAVLVEDLRKRARLRGLADLLDLPGHIAREALPFHLSRAHVFAAPSVYEGGPGLVYLEAMACGLPVIACEGSGLAEIVSHEENGMLVPPSDLNALIDALRRLLGNADEREAMGARARAYVLAAAESKACLRRLEAFYTAVASQRNNLPEAQYS